MAFADTLKKLREREGLTQVALAKKLGVTQRAISYYENGKGSPSDVNLLNKIAKTFNVTLDTLLLENPSDSKVHQLINKLKTDTERGELYWSFIEDDLIIEKDDILLTKYHIILKESYSTEFSTGYFIVTRSSKRISLFVYEGLEFLFITDDSSTSILGTLYDVIVDTKTPHSQLIDKYLNTPL